MTQTVVRDFSHRGAAIRWRRRTPHGLLFRAFHGGRRPRDHVVLDSVPDPHGCATSHHMAEDDTRAEAGVLLAASSLMSLVCVVFRLVRAASGEPLLTSTTRRFRRVRASRYRRTHRLSSYMLRTGASGRGGVRVMLTRSTGDSGPYVGRRASSHRSTVALALRRAALLARLTPPRELRRGRCPPQASLLVRTRWPR